MDHLDQLHAELGLKRLNPTWAKLEIFLGLSAAAVGLTALAAALELLQELGTIRYVGGIALMVFGTYLAMAGHRSHLYQSQNRLAAWLASKVAASTASKPGA